MQIRKLEIKNFRNIGQATYDFETNPVIFGGKNGIGKSNTLNALMWAVTGMLLTDNYGEGENDLDTIVPENYRKGMHTEVTITFESGTTFTKRYKTSFSRESGKANGHTTELLINNVVQNKIADFNQALYECFEFKEVFNAPKVKEVNLFVDPLYALQKLDPTLLRGLLASLGCEITNEEVFNAGYEDLRPYASTYMGKFDTMKKDLKSQNTKLEAKKTELTAQLQTVADVTEFNPEKLKSLNKEKEKLIIQKSKLTGGDNTTINDYEYRIKELKLKKEAEIQKDIAAIDAEINLLDEKAKVANEKIAMQFEAKTSSLKNEIEKLRSKHTTLATNSQSLANKVSDCFTNLRKMSAEAQNLLKSKSDMAVKLTATTGRTYNNYFTCPECGCSFPGSKEDLERFEYEKKVQIEDLKTNIQNCSVKISELKEKCIETEKRSAEYQKQVKVLADELIQVEKEILEKENKLSAIEKEPVDSSETSIIAKELEALEAKKRSVNEKYVSFDQGILELEEKKNMIMANNQEKIQLEVLAIEGQIAEVENEIALENVHSSNWQNKLAWQSILDANQKQINDNDYLLGRVTDFINEMISRLNKKATEKIGIEFVMLEENLTNEVLNPVCYAVVDGVEFKSVNTAKKLEVGIKFIERLKEIAVQDFGAVRNDLPILADRLEGIDSLEKIRNLTKEQLVGTRVSVEEKITIL
ncbi:MAG: AAA family ATPase [Anaeroplasma bactoclasticum]|nr:AAA family ATPase [Anaeroplasma bactoclasticum]